MLPFIKREDCVCAGWQIFAIKLQGATERQILKSHIRTAGKLRPVSHILHLRRVFAPALVLTGYSNHAKCTIPQVYFCCTWHVKLSGEQHRKALFVMHFALIWVWVLCRLISISQMWRPSTHKSDFSKIKFIIVLNGPLQKTLDLWLLLKEIFKVVTQKSLCILCADLLMSVWKPAVISL